MNPDSFEHRYSSATSTVYSLNFVEHKPSQEAKALFKQHNSVQTQQTLPGKFKIPPLTKQAIVTPVIKKTGVKSVDKNLAHLLRRKCAVMHKLGVPLPSRSQHNPPTSHLLPD